MTADPIGCEGAPSRTAAANLGERRWSSSRPRLGWRGVSNVVAAFLALGATPVPKSATSGMLAYPVGYGIRSVDFHVDPWIAVTDATVAPVLTPTQRRVHRSRSIAVDYDADGVPDVAWMVRNRTQMGVLVRLGASGRTVLSYLADGRWSDQQLYRAGRRAIEIEFPESAAVVLSSESGRPMVYYQDEGGR